MKTQSQKNKGNSLYNSSKNFFQRQHRSSFNLDLLKNLQFQSQHRLYLAKLYLQELLKTSNHQSQSRYIELAQDLISPQLKNVEDIVQGIERIEKTLDFEPILVTPKNQESTELQLVTDQGQIKLDESFFTQPYDAQVKFLIDTTTQLNGVDQQYDSSGNAMQEAPSIIKDRQGWAAYIDTLLQVPPEHLPTHVSDLMTLSKDQIDVDIQDDDDIDEDNDNSLDDDDLTIEDNPVDEDTNADNDSSSESENLTIEDNLVDEDTIEDNNNSSDDDNLTIEDDPNNNLITLDENETSFRSRLISFIKKIFNRGT